MNPNEYNEDAFNEASNEFQGNASEMLAQLWEAGASSEDIAAEINDALANAGVSNRYGTGPLTLEER